MKSLSLFFSPTGGGEKVARAIQQGMDGGDCDYLYSLNLNKEGLTQESGRCDGSLPVIFTIPVYGGHLPEIAKSRMEMVRGDGNQPAILVAVYGNRMFENALTDLESFVRERGFNPIAAGAFPCEHSYSSAETPIAVGRPDAKDLEAANEFGRLVREKLLRRDFSTIDTSRLKDEPSPEESIRNFIAFVKEYRGQQSTAPKTYLPVTDTDQCTGCGRCIEICPTSAIGDDFTTEASRCIKCCACVKVCPIGARTFYSPFARPLSENFAARKSPRWIL